MDGGADRQLCAIEMRKDNLINNSRLDIAKMERDTGKTKDQISLFSSFFDIVIKFSSVWTAGWVLFKSTSQTNAFKADCENPNGAGTTIEGEGRIRSFHC